MTVYKVKLMGKTNQGKSSEQVHTFGKKTVMEQGQRQDQNTDVMQCKQ